MADFKIAALEVVFLHDDNNNNNKNQYSYNVFMPHKLLEKITHTCAPIQINISIADYHTHTEREREIKVSERVCVGEEER